MVRSLCPRALAAAALLAGALATLPACRVTSANDDDPVAPDPGPGDVVGVITPNHGHWVHLTAEQLEAGQAVTLTLEGTHTHAAHLDSAQVAAVAAGDQASTVSTVTNAHTHAVTFALP